MKKNQIILVIVDLTNVIIIIHCNTRLDSITKKTEEKKENTNHTSLVKEATAGHRGVEVRDMKCVIIIDYYSIRDRVCYIVYKPASSYFFLFARPVSKYVFKTSLTFFAIVFGSHMAPTPESPHASVFSIGFKKYTPSPNGCFP